MKRAVSLALFVTACGAPTKTVSHAIPRAAPIEQAAPPYLSPARWEFHPTQASKPRARVRLGDGTCVIAAEGGQRWVVTPTRGAAQGPACSGEAHTTEWLALGPAGAIEDLVGVVRRAPNAWAFVGASGALFETSEPLGPFTRTIPSPEPLEHVVGAGPVLLATTRLGRLFRWDEAASWHEIKSIGTRVFDVGLDEAGHALALAQPEALLTSIDAGLTWTPVPRAQAVQVGAQRIGTTTNGELAAVGVLETLAWQPAQNTFVRGASALRASNDDVAIKLDASPSATAIANGRAYLDGDRYFEVTRPTHEGDTWSLVRARLGNRVESIPIAHSEECGSIKLGGTSKMLVAACVHTSDAGIVADIIRSNDAGKTWSAGLTLTTPDTESIAIAVGPDGGALITGTCKANPATPTCEPSAPVLLRPDHEKATILRAAAPPLDGVAFAPAFSHDGRSAYFLGRRAKDQLLGVFVSHDGGESFVERPLALDETARNDTAGSSTPTNEDGDTPPSEDAPLTAEELRDAVPADPPAIRPGEDGAIGVALTLPGGGAYLTADEDARGMRIARVPSDRTAVAGFGRRVLAIHESGERAWESLEGGALWTEIPAALALRGEVLHEVPIACGSGGCLVGDAISRIGWNGQAEPLANAFAHSDPQLKDGAPVARTPIVCEAPASSKWIRVEHTIVGSEGGLLGRYNLPTVADAMRGRALWSILSRDPKSGAISATVAMFQEKGDGDPRIESHTLLGRPNGKGPFAVEISRQVEGYAVARVAYAVDAHLAVVPGRMKNVEIAWENWMDGTSARERVADAGELTKEDVDASQGKLETFLSVSAHGIFFRPHLKEATSFWIEPGGKQTRLDYPAFPPRGTGGPLELVGQEFANAGGRPIAVGMLQHAAFLLSPLAPATPTASAPPINGVAMAPIIGSAEYPLESIDWSYRGPNEVGETIVLTDPETNVAWAYYQAFRGDGTFGPSIALPTPLDLGETPRACTTADRASTPRLAVSDVEMRPTPQARWSAITFFSGTRHPVLVTFVEPSASKAPHLQRLASTQAGASVPHLLLTNATVLHGTPSSPCVAAWTAIGAGGAETSAILAGGSSPRLSLSARRGDRGSRWPNAIDAIEFRALSCHFDSAASVPEEVWAEPGTLRAAH